MLSFIFRYFYKLLSIICLRPFAWNLSDSVSFWVLQTEFDDFFRNCSPMCGMIQFHSTASYQHYSLWSHSLWRHSLWRHSLWRYSLWRHSQYIIAFCTKSFSFPTPGSMLGASASMPNSKHLEVKEIYTQHLEACWVNSQHLEVKEIPNT